MHNSVLVHVIESIADADRDLYRTLNRQCLFFIQNRAQQSSVDPFNDHVHTAACFAVEGLHHARMIQQLTDLFLTLEAFQQNRVGLHLRMRNFEGDLPAVLLVRGPVQRRHAAVGNHASMR